VLSDNPTDKDLHRIVTRANTHKRRRLDNTRFKSSITVDLPFRNITDLEHDWDKHVYAVDWLANKWHDSNNEKFPSLSQIEVGLIKEVLL
jgi:hypothetical protein